MPIISRFSGGEEFEEGGERFGLHVAAILLEEGFRLHHRKTRIMLRECGSISRDS
jgi:hypothetical protein